ncbi:MAG: hypothetical protein ABI876_03555 [Bacteroidota bacterium]
MISRNSIGVAVDRCGSTEQWRMTKRRLLSLFSCVVVASFISLVAPCGFAHAQRVEPFHKGIKGLPTERCVADTVYAYLWFESSDEFMWEDDYCEKPGYFILGGLQFPDNPYGSGVFYLPMQYSFDAFNIRDNVDDTVACNDVYNDVQPGVHRYPRHTDVMAFLDTVQTRTHDTVFRYFDGGKMPYSLCLQWKLLKVKMIVSYVANLWVKVNNLQDVYRTGDWQDDPFIIKKMPYYYIWDILDIEAVK